MNEIKVFYIYSMNIIVRWLAALIILPGVQQTAHAQSRREDIYSASVLYQKRMAMDKDLRERITGRNMSLPLDSNTEDKYMSACWAVSQFLIYNPSVEHGFDTLFYHYPDLSYDTKKALLEAVYAVAPQNYSDRIHNILDNETDPKLFALCAAYLYRTDTSTGNGNTLKIRMVEKFPDYDSLPLLHELADYLSYHTQRIRHQPPNLAILFEYQRTKRQKTIYSFQRWDRDYPGLAIIQDENGRFIKDAQGRLQIFQQLARSGSDLPYFITNGSTPQGIYSIQGTDVSRINLIGPTPNIQLLMPFEDTWEKFFHQETDTLLQTPNTPDQNTDALQSHSLTNSLQPQAPIHSLQPHSLTNSLQPHSIANTLQPQASIDSLQTYLQAYLQLLPPDWRAYTPMLEAWSAGRIGRTEIIAHGTTIDPEYFKDKPFYPLTPTMGCLCAKELWNPTSGHPLVSEQLSLVNAWRHTSPNESSTHSGYLYVINIDDQHTPLTRTEVEAWVSKWEKSYL